ncbi:MAG: methyltransferase domain-containing protein [Pseudomonadota bacterium]
MADDHWSADRYAANARFVTDLAGPVMELLDPQPGERILDLGCGDGPIAKALSDMGCDVTGVDASADMVAGARARGVDSLVADGHDMTFVEEFDAVFSNAALHWMTQPDAAIASVYRALKPGGRFVAEQGGQGNVAAIHTALIAVLADYGIDTDLSDIWYFPSIAEQSRRLNGAGFTVETMAMHPRPTPLAAGMAAWLETLAAPALARLVEADRAEARNRVTALVRPALCDADGNWMADYARLRFRAVKR